MLSAAAHSGDAPDRWWSPGEGRTFPAQLDYANADGALRLLLTGGALDTLSLIHI